MSVEVLLSPKDTKNFVIMIRPSVNQLLQCYQVYITALSGVSEQCILRNLFSNLPTFNLTSELSGTSQHVPWGRFEIWILNLNTPASHGLYTGLLINKRFCDWPKIQRVFPFAEPHKSRRRRIKNTRQKADWEALKAKKTSSPVM